MGSGLGRNMMLLAALSFFSLVAVDIARPAVVLSMLAMMRMAVFLPMPPRGKLA